MVPRPQADEPLFEWLRKLFNWSRLAYARYRLRRRAACIRCGNPSRVSCRACGAGVCNRCWVLSIETGVPAALCLDCTATTIGERISPAIRTAPMELFRVGARTLAVLLAAVTALTCWRHGWVGVWRVAAALVQPAALFAAVPLVLLIGAIRIAIGKALAAVLDSTDPARRRERR